MKKIIYYIAIAACLLSVAACSDFLEEDPKSNPAADTYFKSKSDAYASVNILYRKGAIDFLNGDGIYFGSKAMIPGFMSGLFDNLYKGQEQFIQHAQELAIDPNSDNNTLQDVWQKCYEAIVRNANYALENIPDCPGLNDAERKQLMGEAYFFRAMNYFYLVKMFGAVPIIKNSYSSLENLYVPRSSEKLIYELILSDLNEALNAGMPNKPMWDNGFRVTNSCAQALMADVCLNMTGYPVNDATKYADAAKYAKALIDNSNFALIQHKDKGDNSAYNILRTSDTEREYIYCKEFDNTISTGDWKPVWVFPNEGATWGEFTYSITGTPYNPVNILHAAYDKENDLRYQEHQYFHSTYTQVKGDNAGTVRDLGGKQPYFWWEPEAALNTNTSEKDLVHYRLAEMYLIAAEAIVKSTGSVTDEAAGYLATIEARASLNKDFATIKSELLAMSADAFVREVWTEKIRELIFEYKIWNDITRTRMYPALQGNQFTFVNLVGAQNPWGRTFKESDLYLPICQQEMQRNPSLTQEPLQ